MSRLEALRRVGWLSGLDAASLDRLGDVADRAAFAPGETLVAELEPGDDLLVILDGSARVTVRACLDAPRELGTLGPGDACGEISLITHQLRSATVTAATAIEALRFSRRDFDGLWVRHPSIAVHFARLVALRLREVKGTIRRTIAAAADPGPPADRPPAAADERWSITRAWNEVVTGRRGLSILALGTFLGVLGLLRGAASVLEHGGAGLFHYLRAGYTIGFALLIASTAASLMRFRASWQRAVSVTFGAALALVANGLSVFLAFDVFYLDMTTRDPNVAFDVHALYHRDESLWAIVAGALGLILLGLFGRFWRRIAFLLQARLLRRPR